MIVCHEVVTFKTSYFIAFLCFVFLADAPIHNVQYKRPFRTCPIRIWIFSRWKGESPGPTWMLQRSWWDAHSLTGVTCNIIINLSFYMYMYLTLTAQMRIIPKQLTFHLKGIFDHLSSAEENQLTSYLSCGFSYRWQKSLHWCPTKRTYMYMYVAGLKSPSYCGTGQC